MTIRNMHRQVSGKLFLASLHTHALYYRRSIGKSIYSYTREKNGNFHDGIWLLGLLLLAREEEVGHIFRWEKDGLQSKVSYHVITNGETL